MYSAIKYSIHTPQQNKKSADHEGEERGIRILRGKRKYRNRCFQSSQQGFANSNATPQYCTVILKAISTEPGTTRPRAHYCPACLRTSPGREIRTHTNLDRKQTKPVSGQRPAVRRTRGWTPAGSRPRAAGSLKGHSRALLAVRTLNRSAVPSRPRVDCPLAVGSGDAHDTLT